MKRVFILLLISFLTVPVFAAQREECELCGMWIDQYMSTRHVVTLKDNKTKSFCSIACTAKHLEEHKGKVKDIKVADFLTKKLIDANNAYYLEGSDVPGVMSYVSRIAFSARRDAEQFQKKHGGRIITFKQALENQVSK